MAQSPHVNVHLSADLRWPTNSDVSSVSGFTWDRKPLTGSTIDPNEKIQILQGGWVQDGTADVWVLNSEVIADLQSIVEDLS